MVSILLSIRTLFRVPTVMENVSCIRTLSEQPPSPRLTNLFSLVNLMTLLHTVVTLLWAKLSSVLPRHMPLCLASLGPNFMLSLTNGISPFWILIVFRLGIQTRETTPSRADPLELPCLMTLKKLFRRILKSTLWSIPRLAQFPTFPA